MRIVLSRPDRNLCQLSLAVLICLGILVHAQQTTAPANAGPSGRPAEVPTFKATTRLVTVDVVARDKHGHVVPDLTEKDFQVFEQLATKKGEHEQKINGFLVINHDAIVAASREQTQPKVPAGIYTNLVATRLAVPPTILLLDGLNTEADSGTQARRQMVKMLASIPSDTPVAVFILGHELILLQSFTKDPRLLHEAAERVLTTNLDNGGMGIDPHDDPNSMSNRTNEMFGGNDEAPPNATVSSAPGRGGAGPSGPSGPMGGELQIAEIRRFEQETFAADTDMRVRDTLAALRAIARHVSGYPGRKNLIWVSSSFPMMISPDATAAHNLGFEGNRSYADLVAVATNALADAKVSVYPVNPAGVQTQSFFSAAGAPKQPGWGQQPYAEGRTLDRESLSRFSGVESMTEVANQTGGTICINNNDLGDCVKTAMEEGSSYYELAYYPDASNWHGEFHRIIVKSTRPGLQLSFRQGYFAHATEVATKENDKAGNDPQLQQAACEDLLTSTSLLVVAQALPPDTAKQAKYFLNIDSRMLAPITTEDGKKEVRLDVAVCTFDRSGKALQYMQDAVDQKFEAAQFSSIRGIPHAIAFTPKEGAVRIRLLVRDSTSGQMGSIDVPYGQTGSPPAAASSANPPSRNVN
jgi:VWFA-related protein